MEAKVHHDAIYAPSENVVVREIEGKLIIVPLDEGIVDLEGQFFSPNEVGKAIWDKLDGKRSLREVSEEISTEFEASAQEIEADVIGFAGELLRRRMVVEVSGAYYTEQVYQIALSGPAVVELLQAVIGKGVPIRFRTEGPCMSPFIKDRDLVTVSPLRGASPGIGDVAAFVHRGTEKVLIHRVVGKTADSYLMKGDNAPEEAVLVPGADIPGRVTQVEREGKKIFLGLGPERVLIAFLSRRGLLLPLVRLVRRLVHLVIKRCGPGGE